MRGLAIAAGLAALLGCGRGGKVVAGSSPCTRDADCVPAFCCHPSRCVAPAEVLVCNVACTAGCEPGTLDCGGACFCQDGRCAARLNDL